MNGIFIGSFNPPTKAHLEIVKRLKKDFKKIIIVPVNSREKHLVALDNRLDMLKIMFCKEPVVIDDLMKNYSYVNYRIIDLLKKKYGNITLIIGSDLLDKLELFDNYEYLLSNYSFVVVTRNEKTEEVIKKKYSLYEEKFTIFNYHNEVSSTKARELIKKGERLDKVLDYGVSLYIKEHHLYF